MHRCPVWLSRTLVASSLACGFAGCQRGPKYPTAEVSGHVTLGEQPIEAGSISFVPLENHHGTGVAAPIVDGRYVAKEVPQGKVRLQVVATRDTGRTVDLFGKSVPETVTIVPPKYRIGVELDVNTDLVNHDIDLNSR